MIPKNSPLRIARPTDNLEAIARMYIDGLGFKLIGEFRNHEGFDGKIIGHEHYSWHLEFTHHTGTVVGSAPTQDHLLIFYLANHADWQDCCTSMTAAGFRKVASYNPYWSKDGVTFEDIDGYRIVLQNSSWPLQGA